MRKLVLAGAAILGLMAPAAGAQASVVFNSTFNGLQPSGSWGVYPTADGWTAGSGAGIELQNNVAGSSFTGAADDVFVELDSHNNSSMYRTIADAGDYSLSFLYSPRPGVSAESNPISIYLNDVLLSPIGTFTGAGGSNTSWSAYTVNFSTGANTVLKFAAEGTNDSLGGYVDNIKLETGAVPEPATWAMMIMGFASIGAALRRRRPAVALA
jgi:hypothetical protein